MVVSIAASAVCCRASCCRSNSKAGQVYFQGGPHQTLPQQHIELGGFPAMSEASAAVTSKESKGDMDRPGEDSCFCLTVFNSKDNVAVLETNLCTLWD